MQWMVNDLSQLERNVEEVVETLGLELEPIAVTFSDSPDERGVSRRVRVCEAFDVVRRENIIINFS